MGHLIYFLECWGIFAYSGQSGLIVQTDLTDDGTTYELETERVLTLWESFDPTGTGLTICEISIIPYRNTHLYTSAPTQLDGGAEFSNWTTFSATQSVPANTTLSYKFRTSPDATNWTDYSASQTYSGTPIDLSTLVTSESGDTKYRYIQVESNLWINRWSKHSHSLRLHLNYETAGLW